MEVGIMGKGRGIKTLFETPKSLLQATKGLNLNVERSDNISQLIEIETKEERINRIKTICGVRDHKRKKKGKRHGRK